MTDFFINRNYPKSIIKRAPDLVKLIPRLQILQPNCVTAAEKKTDLKSPVPPIDKSCMEHHSEKLESSAGTYGGGQTI